MLRSAKDGLKLKIQGVYRIQCECGKVYVRQIRRTVEERYKERQKYIRLHQPEKSALAKYCISMGHCMDFSGTSILHRTSGNVDRLVKEAIEIHLNKNNLNRNVGLILSYRLVTYNQNVNEHKSRTEQSGYVTVPIFTAWRLPFYKNLIFLNFIFRIGKA